jgi:hypothetical protein
MTEREFNPIAKQMLKEIFGLIAKDIEPPGDRRAPDFIILGKKNSFLAELKIKEDDPAEMASIKEELKSGEIVSRVTPAGRRNRLDGIIGDGVEQLVSYDTNREHFHVLWIHCVGSDPDFHRRRLTATLFGIQKLFSVDIDPLITCYYFHNSSFFRYRDGLDGIILSSELSIQLCVNSVSPRVDSFRTSELFEAFRSKKGLYDPVLYEGDKAFMIVDSDIDRHNHDKVLNYLKGKYGVNHLQSIDLKKYEGIISIKQPEDPTI